MGDEPGRQNVRFPGGDGEAFGYLRAPRSGSGPGVVVIQEWWGLTTHVESIVERLAEAGFVALAPDLYGGSTTHDSAEAAALLKRLPVERAVEDLAGAVDYLVGLPAVTSSTVGAIGFCMGGGFVFALAARRPDLVSAAVPFYGLPRDESIVPRIRAAVQGHFGLEDRGIPVERVRVGVRGPGRATGAGAGGAAPVPGRSRVPQRREPHRNVRPGVRGAGVVAGGPTSSRSTSASRCDGPGRA